MAYQVETIFPGNTVGVVGVEAFQVKEGTVFWQRNVLTISDINSSMWSVKGDKDTGFGGVDIAFKNGSKFVVRIVVEVV